MENELRANLIASAERLTALTGISEKTIGQKSINDNTFFPRIRGEGVDRPAGFTVKTYDRVMDWMEAELATLPHKHLPSGHAKQASR